MTATTPQAPLANSFDTPDPRVYRTPVIPEGVSEQVDESLSLTRDEIAAIYARQQLEFKIASETPLYTQILMERRQPQATPERPVNPLAAELIAVGDEILRLREARAAMLKENPQLLNRGYMQRLARFVFGPLGLIPPLSEDMIKKFIIEEERRVGGVILKPGSTSAIEYGFYFERAERQKGLDVIQEDEWIFHDLRTNQTVMYPIDSGGISKVYDGRTVPFVQNGEMNELANLRIAIHQYLDRLKNQLNADQA